MGGVRGVDSCLPGWALIDNAAHLGVCSDVKRRVLMRVRLCLDPCVRVA